MTKYGRPIHRSAVPPDTWRILFVRAEREIGILAYSALFLAEDTAVQAVLRDKARAGVSVRILLGDPDGSQVAQRGAEEGIYDVMRARVHNTLILFKPIVEEAGVDLRIHDTALYNSIYRGDDDMIINPHVYGQPASHAPVLHVRGAHQDGRRPPTSIRSSRSGSQHANGQVERGAAAVTGWQPDRTENDVTYGRVDSSAPPRLGVGRVL